MKVKYLIIGAGISGLTFANYVDDYCIIEKENTVGGYCRTIKRNGFIWDYAGHFFHFKTKEFKEKFDKAIDKNEIIEADKCTKIFYKNALIDYPFQMNIHQLEKQDFIDCLYDLFNKEEKETYDNFLDMLYGKFGKSITEMFLKPYNEKLYAVDLKKLDQNAMGRFFPYANKEQIINNMKESKDKSYNNKFSYPKGGAEVFINVLYENLDKGRVKLNTEVEEINVEEKYVITNQKEKIYFDYLINTSPLNKFLDLFKNKKMEELKDELSYNKVLVFNLGFNKKSKYQKEHWMYLPEKKYNYYRIGFYDNILQQNKLSMYIEIGYNKDDEINVEKQLQETLNNLKQQGIIDDTMQLEDYETIIMDPAYVHINELTNDKIAKMMENINKNQIYSIGRYGAWTYCSMEDCMLSAKQLAEQILQNGGNK